MRAHRLPRPTATLATTLAFAAGSAGAQERPVVPERPLSPGAPGLPALPPDTAGTGALTAAREATRRARVRDPGPGPAGRLLRDALAAPHLFVVAPASGLVLGRDVRVERPLVVLGAVHVAASIEGDVIALGELWLRPGARITGRAVAIGGGVHPSTLAEVGGATLAYRTVGFTADATLALSARALEDRPTSRVSLPGTLGLRLPGYTRIDGLVLTFGPELWLDTGRVRIEPLVTYRSHLGVVDPGVRAVAELTRRTLLTLDVARGTFSNETWIRAEPVNAALAFGAGIDARNHWRADRAELRGARRFETTNQVLEPFVGALIERAWSVARDSGARSVPFSVVGRDDPEGMRRINPRVTGGRIVSALAGARWRRAGERTRADAVLQVEQALAVQRGDGFTQATLDGSVTLPGLRAQDTVDVFAHAVATTTGAVPTQRFVYLGGSGTIPSLFLLERGGTELLWVESRYRVPVPGVRVPVLGVPSLVLRHIVGGADVDRLPRVVQNVGLRLQLGLARADVALDPSAPNRRYFSIGVGVR